MCEWLSCGDWCDVRLMCGGRSFNAHRAVLASVSNFLRKALLTCPGDESPVFIFLPDFDTDVMSFVLYYIYNGEVLIPNHQLKIFLDIANVMEIFIDQDQYIPQRNMYKQYGFKSKNSNEIFALENYERIYQLKLFNGNNGYFINVKKGMGTEELPQQMRKSVGTLSFYDNSAQTFRWIEENVTDLGNLTSKSGYRQRHSFLRDIFIQTHSQQANVNGHTSGVLAISSEEYLAPRSVLFTNTNEKHLRDWKTLSDTSKRTSTQNSSNDSILNYLKHLQEHNHPNIDYRMETNKGDLNISYNLYNQFKANNFNAECILENASKKDFNSDLWKNCTPLEISLPLLSKDLSSKFHLEKQNTVWNFDSTKVPSSVRYFPEAPEKCKYATKSNSTYNEFSRTIAKVSILNEVLESPWHPRQPFSYKPVRKKVLNSIHLEKIDENKASINSKDDNNNSDTALKTTVRAEPISSEQQNLKCSVCKEVFTQNQDYNTHMTRHSSMTRYSCVECQKTFSQLRNFKYHMSVHRGTKEFAATCSVCGKHFNDKGYLSNHMKIHRNRKEYKCASCPKSFNQRVAFNMHVRIHTGVKPHVCEECGKAFSRKMLLKQHQRTHSGERPYACEHCDKRFADRSNMTLHLRLHTGVKPFSCTLCPKSFTKKHHLKSHLNFHTGAKPYSCPRCKLAFTQSSNMRTHFKKCNAID